MTFSEGRESQESSPINQQQTISGLWQSGSESKLSRQGVSPTEEKAQMKGAKLKELDPRDVNSEFDLGSVVEVDGPMQCKYGVIRWLGYLQDKNKPIVGLEMVRYTLSQ